MSEWIHIDLAGSAFLFVSWLVLLCAAIGDHFLFCVRGFRARKTRNSKHKTVGTNTTNKLSNAKAFVLLAFECALLLLTVCGYLVVSCYVVIESSFVAVIRLARTPMIK